MVKSKLPLAPSVIAALVAVIGAASLAVAFAPVLPEARPDPEASWYWIIGVPTVFWCTALVTLTTWLARHGASEGLRGAVPIVVVSALGGGAFLGVINSGTCFVVSEWVRNGSGRDAAGQFMLACIFGSPMGGGLGLVFGMGFAIVIGAGIAAAVGRSRDWIERLGIVGGTWLAAVGALGLAMSRLPEIFAAQTGIAAAGVAWIAWSVVQTLRRRRLLRRAMDGSHPLYRLVDLEKDPASAHELGSLVAIPDGSLRSWLSESRPLAGGAFRVSEEIVPVCAVPRDARAALRRLAFRALAGAGVAVTAIAILAVGIAST